MKILHGILCGFAGLALLWAIFAAGPWDFCVRRFSSAIEGPHVPDIRLTAYGWSYLRTPEA